MTATGALLLVAVCVGGCLLLLQTVATPASRIPDYVRGVMARFSLAVLIVAMLIAVALWLVLTQLGLDGLAKPSVASAAALAIGWIVTFGLREYEQARLRDEARRDLLLALRSEIFTVLQTLDETDWASKAATIQQRILEAGDGAGAYHPFSASESPPIVFNALGDKITVLGQAEIGPILRFYAALTDVTTLVEDCRDPVFAGLAADRRVAVHKRLTDTRLAALFWAVQAVFYINRALGVADPSAIKRSENNRQIRIEPETSA